MKYLSTLTIFLVLIGCNAESEINSFRAMNDSEKIWVFSQLNVREETDDLESYYYYAKISKSIYDAISNNEVQQGFILLEDVKYWGNDDLIYDYQDMENTGDIVFRIEDVVRLNPVNFEPIAGKGLEQFQENTVDAPSDAAPFEPIPLNTTPSEPSGDNSNAPISGAS